MTCMKELPNPPGFFKEVGGGHLGVTESGEGDGAGDDGDHGGDYADLFGGIE